MSRLLIFSDDADVATSIVRSLPPEFQVDSEDDPRTCFRLPETTRYDVVLLDLFTPAVEKNWEELLHRFWYTFPAAQLLILARRDDRERAEEAVEKSGAVAVLPLPVDRREWRKTFRRLEDFSGNSSQERPLQDPVLSETLFVIMQTSSSVMKNVLTKVRAVARTDSTVLLTGETGTGKGMLARLVHHLSDRRDRPFISVQCSAMAETLLESELFGHEKGAFTGAIRRKPGKFEISQGGTLFLDEIGTISPATQIRLLQVLEEREYQRVGGEETLHADVRFLAASNSDLSRLVKEGSFRRDLFYRLNVFPIEVPSLRERKEDIPGLVSTFVRRLGRIYRKEIQRVDPRVLQAFQQYDWPGNIRELENLIERAFILERREILGPEGFPSEIFGTESADPIREVEMSGTLAEVRAEGLERVERIYLERLLSRNGGRINLSAREAGIGVRQLHKLLRKYRIQKEEYR